MKDNQNKDRTAKQEAFQSASSSDLWDVRHMKLLSFIIKRVYTTGKKVCRLEILDC